MILILLVKFQKKEKHWLPHMFSNTLENIKTKLFSLVFIL